MTVRCQAKANMPENKLPQACETKQDVRAEIDRIDQALLKLFAERHTYVTRMAEMKANLDEVHAPERITEVITRLRGMATELDMDGDQAETIWRTLIDWNIDYEKAIISARNAKENA